MICFVYSSSDPSKENHKEPPHPPFTVSGEASKSVLDSENSTGGSFMTERMKNAEGKTKINTFKGTGSAAGLNFTEENDSLDIDLKISCDMQRD